MFPNFFFTPYYFGIHFWQRTIGVQFVKAFNALNAGGFLKKQQATVRK